MFFKLLLLPVKAGFLLLDVSEEIRGGLDENGGKRCFYSVGKLSARRVLLLGCAINSTLQIPGYQSCFSCLTGSHQGHRHIIGS